MNCTYCLNELNIKIVKGRVFGVCQFCRFAGYIPIKEPIKTPSEPLTKPIDPIKTPSSSEEIFSEEEGKGYGWDCPACSKSYKTEGGFKRHLQRVSAEEEEHPRVFKRHAKVFEGT